ncbi:MoaD/ThiS family protein [Neisseria sp. Ec49-e6-T10]|uniref:MoaD/ThiS family protein n=1 Tax=Neisseria sp. Ec49-e6-T10 TaxID=3140744 RepID=UPI003EB6C06B
MIHLTYTKESFDMIHLIYFGMLKEALGLSQEEIQWHHGNTDDLLVLLRNRSPEWASVLSENNIFRIAVDHEIIIEPIELKSGATVAILPPVTGG